MARRQSSSDVAIDIGIARSTDFGVPTASARVSPQWRAPRPVSWPPPLPPHRIPGSAPRSAPPNRFHEPVLHSAVLHPPVLAHGVEARKARVWPWALLLVLLATGGAGFVMRQRLPSDVATASAWLRGRIPSDLAERPKVAWARTNAMLTALVSRARSLVPAPHAVPPPLSTTSPSLPTSATLPTAAAPSGAPASAVSTVPEARLVPVTALPVAAPAAAPKVAASHPRASTPKAVTAPVASQAEPPAAPAAAPVDTASEPPASSPAPEPGSLDDLIRRAVEKERKQPR